MATKPERAGMSMGVARPLATKKEKEGTEGAPHPTTKNMDRRGGIGEGVGAGGW